MLRLRREPRNLNMIVACTACNTRFRVADDKIGPWGARVKCTRCGQTFAVASPPPAPGPVPPEPPPVPTHVPPEPTGTGGWPTGVLDIAGGPSSDPVSSIGLALEADPFAAFATRPPPPGPPPDPTPGPAHAAPREGDSGAEDLFGSLPVTNLADLKRSAAAPGEPEPPPDLDPSVGAGLALEERTPSATPVREAAARWGDPEASQAIEVGPDGFQEVDLAKGEAPPDPEFDPMAGEATSWEPVPPRPPPCRSSRPPPCASPWRASGRWR